MQTKIVICSEIWEMLDYFQKTKVDKPTFVKDLSQLPMGTLRFIYQGLVERDDYIKDMEERFS